MSIEMIETSFISGCKTVEYGYKKQCEWNEDETEWVKHNPDGPAEIAYNIDGKPITEKWYTDGDPNSFRGPAFILYDKDGNVISCEYHFLGRQFSKDSLERANLLNSDGSLKEEIEFGLRLGGIEWLRATHHI